MLFLQTAGINRSQLDTPESDSFVAHDYSSLSEQIFDIPMTQVESVVEPDCITDDIGWEPVTPVGIHRPILAN